MSDQPPPFTVSDPDHVQEILCDGQFNISFAPAYVTLTLTSVRAAPEPLFRDGVLVPMAIVRARIVMPVANLEALRELLNRVSIPSTETATPMASGGTRH